MKTIGKLLVAMTIALAFMTSTFAAGTPSTPKTSGKYMVALSIHIFSKDQKNAAQAPTVNKAQGSTTKKH